MMDLKELEKEMKNKYKKFIKGHGGKGIGAALLAAQNWGEDMIVKTDGKLTISAENEIQKILDKLRQEK